MSPEHRNGLDQDFEDSSAHSAEEEEIEEAPLSPHKFQVPAEHPQEQHVQEQMQQAAMKEDICQGLPDPQTRNWTQCNKAEEMVDPGRRSRDDQQIGQGLQQKHAGTDEDEQFYAGRDKAAPIEVVTAATEHRAHGCSLRP